MFTEKERIHLICQYGKDDAIELYRRYVTEKDYPGMEALKNTLKFPNEGYPQVIKDAVYFIEYHYQNRYDHYEEILDFLNTLRAIERQVSG